MSVFLISSFLHGLHSTIGCYISYFSQLVRTWKFHDRTVAYFLFQVFKILQNQYVKFHQASVLTICMLIICLITTKKKPTWMIIEILSIRRVSSSVQESTFRILFGNPRKLINISVDPQNKKSKQLLMFYFGMTPDPRQLMD